ncbi:MAG: tetratricopeptide repeat protein [Bacteroidota bacterium]
MKRFSLMPGIVALLLITQATNVKAQFAKEKADALIAVGMRHLSAPDSLNVYADKLLALSRAEHYQTGEGWALKFKGIAENTAGNYQKAIGWYQQGLKVFTDTGNELEQAKAQLNISIAHQRLSEHKQALEHGEKALYLFEKLKDKNGLGRVLNVIGIASLAQKNNQAARNYFLQYNAYSREVKATAEIANSYNSLGSVYTNLNKLDSAIYFLNSAAAINQTIGNKLALAQNYQNIGIIYQEKKKDYVKALGYHNRAKALYTEVKSPAFLSQSLVNIGQTYKGLLDTVKARAYFRDALVMANQAGEKEVITQAYKSLALLEVQKKDYKKAYENFERSVNTRDSIRGVEAVARMQDLSVKYDTYKKQQQIRELKQQAELHSLQIRERNLYLLIGAVVVVFGVIITAFVANRRKLEERARREQERSEHQELMTRETLNAEERERRRIGHDLHDGVGQLLSAALLNLNSLSDRLKASDEDRDLAGKSIALVSQSYDEMRSISHQIIPNALLKAGLASAVKEFISMIDSNRLKVTLEITGLAERLDDDQTETVLYRIIQETVTNVIKHSGANLLTIQLLKDEEGISLTIEDNGKGFDPIKMNDFKGTGLRNIQSRIALLKGTVEFDSKPGQGTLVAIHVPDTANS